MANKPDYAQGWKRDRFGHYWKEINGAMFMIAKPHRKGMDWEITGGTHWRERNALYPWHSTLGAAQSAVYNYSMGFNADCAVK